MTLDIKNCFPSISNDLVFTALRRHGFSSEIAGIITRICTFERRLPQGSPASSVLCNIALENVADLINDEAIRLSLDFTMYIDDLTLSGKREDLEAAIKEISVILSRSNLKINRGKTQFMAVKNGAEVTGVEVANRVSINDDKVRDIKKEILLLSADGYVSETALRSLWGKIHYLRYIDPQKGIKIAQFANKRLSVVSTYATSKLSKETLSCTGYFNHST